MDDKETQVTEVKETNERVGDTSVQRQSVSKEQTVSGSVIVKRAIWFIAGFIIVLLALRILLLLFGANQENGFVSFLYTLSGVFAAPFFGVFGYEPSYGVSVFEVSSLVAIIIYALVAWGLAKLLTLGKPRQEV